MVVQVAFFRRLGMPMLLLHSKQRRASGDIMSNTTREVEHIVFLKLRKDISTEDFKF